MNIFKILLNIPNSLASLLFCACSYNHPTQCIFYFFALLLISLCFHSTLFCEAREFFSNSLVYGCSFCLSQYLAFSCFSRIRNNEMKIRIILLLVGHTFHDIYLFSKSYSHKKLVYIKCFDKTRKQIQLTEPNG